MKYQKKNRCAFIQIQWNLETMFIWAIFGIHKKLRLSNYSLKHGSSFWNICNLEHSYTITMTPATVCFSTVPRSIMPCKEYFILVTCQTNGEWGNSQNGVVHWPCDGRHSDGFCWQFLIWFIPQKKNHQVSVWTKYFKKHHDRLLLFVMID